MKKLGLFVLFLALFSGAVFAQQLPEIIVINNTGYTGYYLYITTIADDTWGSDLLGNDVLMDGEATGITLAYPLTVTNAYDFCLVDSDGDEYYLYDVPVLPNSIIVFTFSDFWAAKDSNLPLITVINNTGYDAYECNVSQTASDTWGINLLGDYEWLYDGEALTVRLPYPLNVTNTYDFRLVDVDDDPYYKMNVAITQNSRRIEFTFDDIDW